VVPCVAEYCTYIPLYRHTGPTQPPRERSGGASARAETNMGGVNGWGGGGGVGGAVRSVDQESPL